MLEKFVEFLQAHNLTGAPIVFIVSMLPIFELRGGIPLGLLHFKIPVLQNYLLCIAGNILPVLPIILYLEKIRNLLSKIKIFKKFFDWLYNRTYKRAKKVEKYGAIGLTLFVAIPLPVTGAWTGSVAAVIFDIPPRYALPAIFLGVCLAGIIVTLLTLGVTLF